MVSRLSSTIYNMIKEKQKMIKITKLFPQKKGHFDKI